VLIALGLLLKTASQWPISAQVMFSPSCRPQMETSLPGGALTATPGHLLLFGAARSVVIAVAMPATPLKHK
jgi:hypothetical protein